MRVIHKSNLTCIFAVFVLALQPGWSADFSEVRKDLDKKVLRWADREEMARVYDMFEFEMTLDEYLAQNEKKLVDWEAMKQLDDEEFMKLMQASISGPYMSSEYDAYVQVGMFFYRYLENFGDASEEELFEMGSNASWLFLRLLSPTLGSPEREKGLWKVLPDDFDWYSLGKGFVMSIIRQMRGSGFMERFRGEGDELITALRRYLTLSIYHSPNRGYQIWSMVHLTFQHDLMHLHHEIELVMVDVFRKYSNYTAARVLEDILEERKDALKIINKQMLEVMDSGIELKRHSE